MSEHGIDKARTIVHDYDRAGDHYSTWCLCGEQLTNRVPCWKPHNETCDSNVEDALVRHRVRHLNARSLPHIDGGEA